MAIFKQTWTLTKKNLKVVFVRHWFFTSVRAFWAPIIFMFFITYAKNFFVPPSEFGIGEPRPIRSLENALQNAQGGRDKIVFVNSFQADDINRVIETVSDTVRGAGATAVTVEDEVDLLDECKSTLRGASSCFGAVVFNGSPDEGGIFNYTLRADGALGTQVYVDQDDNEIQLYILPLQRAVDDAIVSSNGTELPTIEEFIFTDKTQEEREERIRRLYQEALINIVAVALYIGICGVTYQLTGHMAQEREGGLSQLIEAMTPSKRAWHIQAARLIANHIAFSIIYLPGWIIMACILRALAYVQTSFLLLIVYHIIIGFSLTSFSIFGASFFRKAQLSGITITILAIVLAIVAQVAGPWSTGPTAIFSILFPSMNYVFFMIYVGRFERVLRATNLVESAPPYNDNNSTLPGIAFWVFAIIQIFVYPVLAAIIERWLHGTVSKERKTTISSPDHSIILSNFSKHWTPSWFKRKVLSKFGLKPPETVIAVNDLSLKARRGQILVLLGANGSGKSTTLDAISGLNTITNGSIEIDGTGGLGLCPQKNVMWDELTVLEHVQIFNRLKSTGKGDDKETLTSLIRACDLGHKVKAKSETLSGGQKRKLQLAMMFTGGSKVCCVDEVSSGLDPLSRRKIWEILLAERGDRTFMLTTHFLDEADVLADYVAILSRGNLKTKGTSVQLKHEVGAGYRVTVPRDTKLAPTFKETRKIPTSEDKTMYWFPTGIEATRYIDELRKNGITDYDLIGPSLEDVFLALAEEVKENRLDESVLVGSDEHAKQIAEMDVPRMLEDTSDMDKGVNMSEGKGTSMFMQTWILMRKRFTILKRNYLPYVCAVLLPVVAAGLVTLFLKGFVQVGCDPGANANDPEVFSLSAVDEELLIPIGPRDLVDLDLIAERTGVNTSVFQVMDTYEDFTNFIDTRFREVMPGGFFLQEGRPPVMAYVGNVGVVGGLVVLATLNNIVSDVPISTQYQEFSVPFAPSTGDTLQLILYLGLAMSVYPAFFALYPTVERLRKVRALHYSNGIRAAPLWIAYLLFDFVFVLIISALVTIILASVSHFPPGPSLVSLTLRRHLMRGSTPDISL